ncbi:hypothetical protein HPB52_012011 [Rhipicephalus sanguineus]|uniref:Uncharacterized protein n=1 Tax=Rhipicephalus sanguineus TaxID=34632 RepID=A0A9D4SUA9_RHISA|nr:hypothetical protein HPB52_012011 [Rhipicephalus sanguineus]
MAFEENLRHAAIADCPSQRMKSCAKSGIIVVYRCCRRHQRRHADSSTRITSWNDRDPPLLWRNAASVPAPFHRRLFQVSEPAGWQGLRSVPSSSALPGTCGDSEHCFTFNVPEDTVSIDEIIDSIEETVGDEGVLFLQHLGTTADQATSLLVNEGFCIRKEKVSVDAVGPPIVHVNVYRLPPYVSNDSLVAALQPCGKVRDLQYTTVQKRQTTYSGTRVVKMEMTRPAPNFVTVLGHRAMLEYRGMRRVCARCSGEGHMAATCTKPFSQRCSAFGHVTETCTVACRKCGGDHSAKECFRRKSYAAVTQSTVASQEDFASLSEALAVRTRTPDATPRLQVLKPTKRVVRRAPPDSMDSDSAYEQRSHDAKPETSSSESEVIAGESSSNAESVATTSNAVEASSDHPSSQLDSDSTSASTNDKPASSVTATEDGASAPCSGTEAARASHAATKATTGKRSGSRVTREEGQAQRSSARNRSRSRSAQRKLDCSLEEALLQLYFGHMDPTILHNEECIKYMETEVAASIGELDVLDPATWDRLKKRWRLISEEAGKERHARITSRMNETLRRIQIVERGGTSTQAMRDYVDAQRKVYSSPLHKRAQASRIADELQLPSDELRNLAFAVRVGTRRNQPQLILTAKREDGSITTEPVEVRNTFRTHFERLFAQEPQLDDCDIESRFLTFCDGLPKLKTEDTEGLHSPATKDEVSQALKAMNARSAPGPDGILTAFYVRFFEILGDLLTDVVNIFITEGKKPLSFRDGRVVLLLKEGMDRSNPKSWRPITLLNTDYKLVATLLVLRLRPLLNELVSPSSHVWSLAARLSQR